MGTDKRELRNGPSVVAIAPPPEPQKSAADELRELAYKIDGGQYGTIVLVAGVLADNHGNTGPFTCGMPVSKAELVGTLTLAATRLALAGG